MSNFLDLDPAEDQDSPGTNLREMLTRVPVSTPRPHLSPEISDRLAAVHGFASRDHSATTGTSGAGNRRQPRGIRAEETRQLSIRMPASLYNEFLAFADNSKLTYNEAIRTLLDLNKSNRK